MLLYPLSYSAKIEIVVYLVKIIMGAEVGFEPTLSYFDRRQTIVVVFTPFECKNATRLQHFPWLCTRVSYIHRNRYRWKSPLLAKLKLIFLWFTVPYPILLHWNQPLAEATVLRHSFIESLVHFIKNKLRHGEHIHINLFNLYRSRRTLLRVLFS